MSRVILGVTGGIAAYKACELLRRLSGSGHEVIVVPTVAALEFVGAATWAALSGRPVHTSVFDDAHLVPHVQLGRDADLVLVAPASADLLARAATGRADDLLTNVLLTTRGPVVHAPAMHTEMWQHPATRANVELLRERGAVVIDPDNGRLTGPDSGPGRLPDPAEIWAVATSILADPSIARRAADQDMAGLTVAVSAGGTREHLDPVRFVGNASSGLMGWAMARAAALRGAGVRVVAAHVSSPPPPNVEVDRVTSTAELASAMEVAAKGADLIVMAAAPADFTPVEVSGTKIKKSNSGGLTLELVQTTDVLAGLVAARTDPRQVLVGFAAETRPDSGSLLELGQAKLSRKGCDLLVLNEVGPGLVFGQQDSEITILGGPEPVGPLTGSKDTLAHHIWDEALAVRSRR
ncbi:MAG TPA: bifunctional phosphopantothenoylcysteine decarboxylase/phosphopantothenate--cysteine ligase CoaBC [Propionibacteriaceae bacterium]|nr:bifunctional phosphopantothenoylcysteine decarboxylase/phosphopantothenate--cysteine ligase CoaBC [Propionibacteriaceae bacterium]